MEPTDSRWSFHRSQNSTEGLLSSYDDKSETEMHSPGSPPRPGSAWGQAIVGGTRRASRRTFFAACALFSALSLIALAFYTMTAPHYISASVPHDSLDEVLNNHTRMDELCANRNHTATPELLETPAGNAGPSTDPDVWQNHPLNSKNFLIGGPTTSFRSNLRDDVQYITSWPAAGWTNDVMTYAHLIYLAKITDRVPILPKFMPSHVGNEVPPVPFGEVFDVERLSKALQIPILEWSEVKDENSDLWDDMSCWSVWMTASPEQGWPRPSGSPNLIRADISYTAIPYGFRMAGYENDLHITFWSLASLSYPAMRNQSIMNVEPLPSPIHNNRTYPDDHLLCYDYLYYVAAQWPYEWDKEYAPQWKDVGRYMYWAPGLLQIADWHIRQALNISDGEATPIWIAVHVRHHDFAVHCQLQGLELEDCFAPLSAYERRVQQIQQELRTQKGIDVQHVIMTSDETDPEWWDKVDGLGWYHVDYAAMATEEIYGKWYPVFIDAVIQSTGVGLVGTDHSTMSVIAGRRTESWQGGIAKHVKWGRPGADND